MYLYIITSDMEIEFPFLSSCHNNGTIRSIVNEAKEIYYNSEHNGWPGKSFNKDELSNMTLFDAVKLLFKEKGIDFEPVKNWIEVS